MTSYWKVINKQMSSYQNSLFKLTWKYAKIASSYEVLIGGSGHVVLQIIASGISDLIAAKKNVLCVQEVMTHFI